MNVDYSSKFLKQAKKAPKHIRVQIIEKIEMFVKDPFSVGLNNHALTGKLCGCRSININGDWRLVYKSVGKHQVLIISVGTHSELYG